MKAIKIWVAELENAEEYFEGNNQDYYEFVGWLTRFFRGIITEPSRRNVKLYLKAKRQHFQYVYDSSLYGKEGFIKRVENQSVNNATHQSPLESPLFTPLESTLSSKEKKEKEKKEKEKKVKKKSSVFTPPNFVDFENYCKENGFQNIAERAFKGYSENDWKDSRDNPVLNWKSKLQNVWFNDSNRDKTAESKPNPLAPRPSSNPVNPYDAFR